MVELNLALKKDVFEALQNKTSNEIPIKKNDWWRKRLMDLDTGRFKWFDVVIASSGSSDKYRYEIDHIEARDDSYVIVVVLDKPAQNEAPEEKDLGDSDSDVLEPERVVEQTINDVTPEQDVNDEEAYEEEEEIIEPKIIKPVVIEPVKVKPAVVEPKENVELKDEKENIKRLVLKVFDRFCKMPDVYVVNMPYVTIRNSGAIIGCNRRLLADRDSDVRIDFKKVEITQNIGMSDEVFLGEVIAYFSKLLKNNYVFVNRKYCGFATSDFDELIFKMAVVSKKKYLFLKK